MQSEDIDDELALIDINWAINENQIETIIFD